MDTLQYEKLAVEYVNKKVWSFADDGSRTPDVAETYEVCLYADRDRTRDYLITVAKGSDQYRDIEYTHLRFDSGSSLSRLTQAVERCNEVVSGLGVELAEPSKEEEIERLEELHNILYNVLSRSNERSFIDEMNKSNYQSVNNRLHKLRCPTHE